MIASISCCCVSRSKGVYPGRVLEAAQVGRGCHVTTEKEVGDHTHRPYVDRLPMTGYKNIRPCTRLTKQQYSLFLKISGAMYYTCGVRAASKIWEITLTPGVPQISVSIWNFSSSITRLRPKSAIIMSASSALVRKMRFSGFRSGGQIKLYECQAPIKESSVPLCTIPHSWMYFTAPKMVRTSAAASL